MSSITAAGLLTRMPELGRLDAKAVASLAGLAPVTRQSGAWQGRSFIQGGRPRVRRLLYMPALAAIRCNPGLRAKYRQLRGLGKPPKVALTAVMRKLLMLANPLLEQNRSWLPDRPGRRQRGGAGGKRAVRRRMTSPWAPRLAGRIRAAEDQVKCTSVCGRARSAVAERTTTAGIWPSVTTRGAVRGSTAAGRIVVGARACNACSGTPRCAVVTSAAFACWLTTSMSMTVRIFGVRHRGCASCSTLGKCKDWRDAGFALRGHRSPAQGRSLPCRYVRSPEVTSGLAATFDHRTYRSAPVPECTDSPPAADELFPRSGPLTTWILICRWKQPLVQAHLSL